jgi:hypothetical protein
MCFSKAKINIGSDGLQGNLSLVHNLLARNFGIAQTAGGADADTLGSRLHGAEDCLFHRSPIGNTPLNLVSNGPADEIGIQFRLADFTDIEADFFAHELL